MLTVAEEAGRAWTLEVVVLAELTLVAALAVAHAAAALALPVARAGLVLAVPHTGRRVAQRARGAVASFAAPEGGAGHGHGHGHFPAPLESHFTAAQ